MKYNKEKRLDYICIVLIILGVLIITTGVRMNDFVSAQNGGKMPVLNWDGTWNDVFASYQNVTSNTKFIFLVDRYTRYNFSLGDFIIVLGVIPLMFATSILLMRNNLEEQPAGDKR